MLYGIGAAYFYLKRDPEPSDTGDDELMYYPAELQRYVKPHLSLWERFKIYVAILIHDLLTDPSIDQEGLNFLDKLFRHEKIHEAGLSLLTNVLIDPRFMKEAQIFGTDLISFTLR